ncbi:hypothetical protein A3Q56_07181 [Intoshia linei]|uniref:DUF659 domain-containing protein n=1 Tax=Intoshia linei TaxID=1819745 RepID=A0A177AST2_9BILA|nr:hypothetical protein A3Q56_07181 [Intoshia linei]
MRSHIGIIIVYQLNGTWVEVLVLCSLFSQRHTGVNIRSKIVEHIKYWNLNNKVSAIVADNASNNVKALNVDQDIPEQNEYMIDIQNAHFVRCFSHTVQLTVNDILKDKKNRRHT